MQYGWKFFLFFQAPDLGKGGRDDCPRFPQNILLLSIIGEERLHKIQTNVLVNEKNSNFVIYCTISSS